MNGPTWFLIGVAAGVAGIAAVMLTRALIGAFRTASHDLATRIDDLLDTEEEPEAPHVEDDVWDRDLRTLLTDSID